MTQARRHHAQQLVAPFVTEGIVDTLEVVEVEIEHCESAAMLFGSLDGANKPRTRLLAIRQPGERVEVCKFYDATLCTPLAPERDRHLPHLVRVKRLLQIGQLVLGGYHAADLTGLHVRIRGADDGLNLRIKFSYSACGP